jgi:Cdc6-like AAA superfamily ATPase
MLSTYTDKHLQVASISGDIRRALELCRRAVEIGEARMKLHEFSSQSFLLHDSFF